jgi:hypothetical protein
MEVAKEEEKNTKQGPQPQKSPPHEGAPSNPKSHEAPSSSSARKINDHIPTKNQYEILSDMEEDPKEDPKSNHQDSSG